MRILAPPYAEPLSLDEAKSHLRLTTTADDADIGDLISVARADCENTTHRTIVDTLIEHRIDCFPLPMTRRSRNVYLPRGPVANLVQVTYLDQAGDEQVLSASDYLVGTQGLITQLTLPQGKYWPTTLNQAEAVRIQYWAGLAAAVTAIDDDADTITIVGRPLANDDTITLTTSGTLPAALLERKLYYIVNASEDGQTIQLSETQGGDPIDLTDAGTGQHFLGKDLVNDWVLYRRAMRLILAHWYENREETILGTGSGLQKIPRGAERLLEQLMPGDDFTEFEPERHYPFGRDDRDG